MLADTVIQVVALRAVKSQPWFVPFDTDTQPIIDIPTSEHRAENSVLFIISTW
jgi:hypothetical protein